MIFIIQIYIWKILCIKKQILNFNIPTFGYIWSIIDYGDIQSRRFKYSIYNRLKLFVYRNLAYEDIIQFIHFFMFYYYIILEKIIRNIKLSESEIKKKFTDFISYEDMKKMCKYAAATDHKKIIKYFYSKITK